MKESPTIAQPSIQKSIDNHPKRGKRLRRSTGAAAITAALLLGGCTGSSEGSDTPSTVSVIRPTLPSEAKVALGKKTIYAPGDSFTSGEGDPSVVKDSSGKDHKLFLEGTSDPNNHCHRSLNAYPVKLWEKLGKNDWSLEFQACSGAKMENVFEKIQKDKGKIKNNVLQGEVLTKGMKPDLIVLTMGGNDAGFADILADCMVGGYIPDLDNSSCNVSSTEKKFKKDLSKLQRDLPEFYNTLKGHLAEDGQMMVAGYPKFFSDESKKSCGTGLKGDYFIEKDIKWLNSAAVRANDIIEHTAAKVGISFVDTENLFSIDGQQHDVCAKGETNRWLNRAIPTHKEWSFHPKTAAHEAESDLFLACYNDPSSCEPKPDPDALVEKPLPLINDCLYKDDPTMFQKLETREVIYADVTGDGVKDALAHVQCSQSTESWPEELRIFDGNSSSETPTLIGTLLNDANVRNVTVNVPDATTIDITSTTISQNGSLADPDLIYKRQYRWNGQEFISGQPQIIPKY